MPSPGRPQGGGGARLWDGDLAPLPLRALALPFTLLLLPAAAAAKELAGVRLHEQASKQAGGVEGEFAANLGVQA